ncbi:methyltransferase domain-containing protein [Hansschlegelia sp. KR7-227]|uniref:methyltransferase domain-containing protein n=1 Tax=Hansschlegelia sp. KR7-227 TaxID=3400914 RepID=UPI003C07D583
MTAFAAPGRSRAPELMDDDATDYETFRACLVDLARVNRLSLGYRPTLGFLDRLLREGRLPKDRPTAIVDVGSGYGDTLREIADWARRRGVAVALTGLDRNPWAERAAREAGGDPAIDYRTADVFDVRFDGPVDVVLSALFTHHLDDAALVAFLRWMERTAGVGWFVNDLHRNRLPVIGFKAAAWALRMHRFVRHDGPVSFARAFVAEEWRGALAAADVPEGAAEIVWRTPFRLCVSRVRR